MSDHATAKKRYHAPPGYEVVGEVEIDGAAPVPLYMFTGNGEGGETPFDRFAVDVDGSLYFVDQTIGKILRYTGKRVVDASFQMGGPKKEGGDV